MEWLPSTMVLMSREMADMAQSAEWLPSLRHRHPLRRRGAVIEPLACLCSRMPGFWKVGSAPDMFHFVPLVAVGKSSLSSQITSSRPFEPNWLRVGVHACHGRGFRFLGFPCFLQKSGRPLFTQKVDETKCFRVGYSTLKSRHAISRRICRVSTSSCNLGDDNKERLGSTLTSLQFGWLMIHDCRCLRNSA